MLGEAGRRAKRRDRGGDAWGDNAKGQGRKEGRWKVEENQSGDGKWKDCILYLETLMSFTITALQRRQLKI